ARADPFGDDRVAHADEQSVAQRQHHYRLPPRSRARDRRADLNDGPPRRRAPRPRLQTRHLVRHPRPVARRGRALDLLTLTRAAEYGFPRAQQDLRVGDRAWAWTSRHLLHKRRATRTFTDLLDLGDEREAGVTDAAGDFPTARCREDQGGRL